MYSRRPAFSLVKCNVRLQASCRGCNPTVFVVNSLTLRDRLQNCSHTKAVSKPTRCSGEQMSAAQTIEFKAPSQKTGKTAPRAARPRRVSGRRLLLASAAIVAIAGAADYGWHYWTTGRFEVSTDDAYVKADSTIIAPKVAGYLSEVLVGDNQPVKAGE